MPKVSVIIPVYNAREFVAKCIENCQSQTLEDIEIVIVDDKSTDNTVQIVKSYMQKDNRIKLIELEQNNRQGYARNVGIQHSNSDYIMFLDVDDFYENNCIELMYQKIIEDSSDMTVCKISTVDYQTEKIERIHDFKNYSDIPKDLYSGFCYKDIEPSEIFNKCNVVWDKIYKKSFLTENNITFPAGMFCEDDVFSFKAFFRAKKITVLDKYLVFYRINRPESTSVIGDKTAFDCFKMFELIKNDLSELNLYYDFYQVLVCYHVNVCLYFYDITKRKYKKEFYNKMRTVLQNYQGFIDTHQNKKFNSEVYNNLNKILSNNYYLYELKKFSEKFFRRN